MSREFERAYLFEFLLAVIFPYCGNTGVLEANYIFLVAVHSLIVGLFELGYVGVLECVFREWNRDKTLGGEGRSGEDTGRK